MKVLGYVDLPDMEAPTEIATTTGMDQNNTLLIDSTGYVGGWGVPLTNETNRQMFNGAGAYADAYAKAGIAVVISKSEQKATFIDLKPLFTYFDGVYFGGTQQTFSTTVNNLGQAPTQWPHAFSYKPEQIPTVIKTVSLANRPTAVRTTLWGPAQRAWIATQDGQLHIYGLGNYPTGAGAPTDIAEKGSVTVGRNPTGLSTSKFDPDNNDDTINSEVVVVSRGDRKIQWVRFAADHDSGSVLRTLQDTRIIDPIWIDDGDEFYNQEALVTIADYGGKVVSSFRFGPVIFGQAGSSSDGIPWACQGPQGCGMGASGNDPFEFGGSFALPGKPFQFVDANVP